MEKTRYKKFVALQICGLVLLLCGQWPLAMVLFVIGHIMSVRPQKEVVQQEPVEARQTVEAAIQSQPDPADYWKGGLSETMPVQESEPEPPEEPLNKRHRKNRDPYKGLKSVISPLTEGDGTYSKYPPNAFVIKGAKGKPLLCDYDEQGVPTDKGIELESSDAWLEHFGTKGLDSSSVILVHAVKGSEQNLVKALQVHRVERKGKPVSVGEMSRDGVLMDVAESLRATYIEEYQVESVNKGN